MSNTAKVMDPGIEAREQACMFLKSVLFMVCQEREQIDVSYVIHPRTTVYFVKVAKSDLGRVLGKSGSFINALRTILASILAQDGIRGVIDGVTDEYETNQNS